MLFIYHIDKRKNKMIKFVKRATTGVAAAMAAIVIMANSGVAIAHAMYKVPVLGVIAKVVTFREYTDSTNKMEADIKIPEVSIENEDGTTSIVWKAFEGVGIATDDVEAAGSIQVELDAETIAAVQNGTAFIAVVSE